MLESYNITNTWPVVFWQNIWYVLKLSQSISSLKYSSTHSHGRGSSASSKVLRAQPWTSESLCSCGSGRKTRACTHSEGDTCILKWYIIPATTCCRYSSRLYCTKAPRPTFSSRRGLISSAIFWIWGVMTVDGSECPPANNGILYYPALIATLRGYKWINVVRDDEAGNQRKFCDDVAMVREGGFGDEAGREQYNDGCSPSLGSYLSFFLVDWCREGNDAKMQVSST